jgi:hypothetical protein
MTPKQLLWDTFKYPKYRDLLPSGQRPSVNDGAEINIGKEDS